MIFFGTLVKIPFIRERKEKDRQFNKDSIINKISVMNENFQQLDSEHQKAKNSEDTTRQKIYLQKMKENLIIRNVGEEVYNQIVIRDATYEQIREIDGDMNRKESEKKMTETGDFNREELHKQNKYGPNNQYP